MKPTLPTVTVAVVAHNEQDNIAHFLASVLVQSREGYVLEKILVISDGSTDQTNTIVKELAAANPIIRLIEYPTRVGKSTHLNTIYQSLTSDILVQSDADVIWEPQVIASIIKPIVERSQTGMCGGNPQPIHGTTFVEKAVNITTEAYIPLRWLLRGGNNIFSADGRLLAYRKEVVKKITVPVDMIANDMFTYFSCLKLGWSYAFVRDAIVHYRSPTTVRDHIRQNTRFAAAGIRMRKYFPLEMVQKEYSAPGFQLKKQMLRIFFKHPLMGMYIFILNRFCVLNAIKQESRLTGAWPIAHTTKRLIQS
jgi:cellulose synthase/poly-beta-1,6-N-acetylglucosamine synthase-like glycosyltransferase